MVGTYRTSKNLEEQPGAVKEEAKSGGGDAVVATDMYATVDYSKKTSRKKQQQGTSMSLHFPIIGGYFISVCQNVMTKNL